MVMIEKKYKSQNRFKKKMLKHGCTLEWGQGKAEPVNKLM